MLARSRALFIKEYNNKLFNWLVIFSLIMVVIGRFVIKFFLLEIAAWVMFAFLETYTRLFWSSESLYYNPVWHVVVSTWETIVYSPILDLDRYALFLPVTIHRHVILISDVFLLLYATDLLAQMGNPNPCRAVVFGNLLALSGWKERDRTVVAASVQWVLQKLQSSKNRLIHQVHTNKSVYILHLLAGRDFISAPSQQITDSFNSTWQCENEHPGGTL